MLKTGYFSTFEDFTYKQKSPHLSKGFDVGGEGLEPPTAWV